MKYDGLDNDIATRLKNGELIYGFTWSDDITNVTECHLVDYISIKEDKFYICNQFNYMIFVSNFSETDPRNCKFNFIESAHAWAKNNNIMIYNTLAKSIDYARQWNYQCSPDSYYYMSRVDDTCMPVWKSLETLLKKDVE